MTLTINLADDETTLLNAKASAEGMSAEQWARLLLKHALESPALGPAAHGPARPHIGEVIRERMSKVPPGIMAAMPADGASQHDHYIYGVPKREE